MEREKIDLRHNPRLHRQDQNGRCSAEIGCPFSGMRHLNSFARLRGHKARQIVVLECVKKRKGVRGKLRELSACSATSPQTIMSSKPKVSILKGQEGHFNVNMILFLVLIFLSRRQGLGIYQTSIFSRTRSFPFTAQHAL